MCVCILHIHILIYALCGVCQYKIYSFCHLTEMKYQVYCGAEERTSFEVPGRTVDSSAVEELAPVGLTCSFICSVSSLKYLLPHIA